MLFVFMDSPEVEVIHKMPLKFSLGLKCIDHYIAIFLQTAHEFNIIYVRLMKSY